MTKYFIIIILTFFTLTTTCGQMVSVSCNCPKTEFAGTKADTTFHLSNGKTIVLCGYKNSDSKPITFSEFVLAVCGQDSIIDFWGAVLTCRLKVNKDTLIIDQLVDLPTGKSFKYQETIWDINKIYFKNQKVVKKNLVNREITKYNSVQIGEVLNEYETGKPGLDDGKMEIANKLLIATISGDKTARRYFKEFKNKFGILGGSFAEEYNDLMLMLRQWDKNE